MEIIMPTNPDAQSYVAGFLFDPLAEVVVLVRKERPEWQRGLLNGVGGHIEPGETPYAAMRREFNEEAGLDIQSWDKYASVWGPWGVVYFYRAFGNAYKVETRTDERIEIHMTDRLPKDTIPNLQWLIPLALYKQDQYEEVQAREVSQPVL